MKVHCRMCKLYFFIVQNEWSDTSEVYAYKDYLGKSWDKMRQRSVVVVK